MTHNILYYMQKMTDGTMTPEDRVEYEQLLIEQWRGVE